MISKIFLNRIGEMSGLVKSSLKKRIIEKGIVNQRENNRKWRNGEKGGKGEIG